MKLSNYARLYKYIKDNDGEGLKEYSKSMSPEETTSFRTGRFTFFIISIIARFYLRNKVTDRGLPIPKEHIKYYNYKDVNFNDMLQFNHDVMKNQSNWNVLKLLDHVKDDSLFVAVEKEHNGKFDGFEDTLQWNTYYATSLMNLEQYYTDKMQLQQTIVRLLKGIDKCITHNAIKRHPLESIDYDLEPISQDMVSGLLQLLLNVPKGSFEKYPMLQTIKDKTIEVFTKSDYRLMYPDGTVNSYDLAPNFIYNHAKCFIYSGLRMIDGKFNKSDKSILMSMLKIMPYSPDLPQNRSMYGAVVAMNALEAIALNDRDVLLAAIDWAEYLVSTSYEQNAEFDSILANMFEMQGYKTKAEKYANRTLGTLSTCPTIGIEKNRNTLQRDTVPGKHPRPPLLRRDEDWFWQRKAYSTGAGSSTTNMIEISAPLARIASVFYYPDATID